MTYKQLIWLALALAVGTVLFTFKYGKAFIKDPSLSHNDRIHQLYRDQ